MTTDADPVAQAINDARALLDTLLASGWGEVHVVSGDTEIFIARQRGAPNPMRAAPPEAGSGATVPPAPERLVSAPHVATLVDALPLGTVVAVGDAIATLRVLEDREIVEAPVAGTIVRIDATIGSLLDYGAPLLAIGEAA